MSQKNTIRWAILLRWGRRREGFQFWFPSLAKEGGKGVVALVGGARRARPDAQTGVGGLSETALPYLLESPLNQGEV